MPRHSLHALLLAGLLLGAAIGAGAAPPPPTTHAAQVDDDRPPDVEMLGLDSPTRAAVEGQGVDVSAALAIQRDAAESSIDRRALAVTFERAAADQERRELLFEAATDVEIATSELRSDNRELRANFLNGTVGPDEYLRSRATAAVRAEQLRSDLELIQRFADRVPQLSMRSRLEALRVGLTGANGPVSDRAAATLVGEQPALRVYVEVSPDGRVLSAVAGDRYVREAYRSDLWTPDTTSGVAFDEAVARTAELYPVAFNSSRNLGRGFGEHGAGTYEVSMEVQEGEIVTFLDGDASNVFYETQLFTLASIPPGPPVTAAENGTRLAVNVSYDGGPLRVATVDNSTGSPTDVPVLVGDHRYRTGPDGVVWVVDPAGPTDVVALGDAGNVSIGVPSRSPSLVDVGTAG